MNMFKRLSLGLFASLVSYSAFADPCSLGAGTACNAGALEAQIAGQATSVVTIFYYGAAIIGIALVIMALLKLKAHSMDTQGQGGHARTAIYMLIIGGCLIAVPTIMLLSSSTLLSNTLSSLPSENGLFSG